MTAVLVFLGAGVGGMARYGVGILLLARNAAFPWGTFAVNVSGALLFGLIAGVAGERQWSAHLQVFLIAGLCGGFTTFSAFSAETLGLMQSGHWGRAASYAVASVALCVLATMIGLRLGGAMPRA